jgi:nucleotidyltransferase substrate binding protein (TIGR01987 family)
MKDRLNLTLAKFEKALSTLKVAIDKLYSDSLPKDIYEFVQDSVIQRYEYTIELAWKAIKACLKVCHGIECVSPKDCCKQAYKVGLIDNLEIFFEMIYCRNLTSHTYDFEQAEKLVTEIDRFLPYLTKLYEVLKVSSEKN